MSGNPLAALLHSLPSLALTRYLFRDIVVNIAIYIPLGATAHLALHRAGAFRNIAPVLLGFFLSLLIEIAQAFTPTRVSNLHDVICNAAGAAIGAIVAGALREFLPVARVQKAHQSDRVAGALLCCWIAYILFPAFPLLSRTALLLKMKALSASPLFRLLPFVSAAIGWFIAGPLLMSTGFRSPRILLAVSVVLIPAQLLVVGRQPSFSELAGALAGSAAFALVDATRWRWTAACAVLGALILRGLAPFYWQTSPNPVTWVPFGGVLAAEWQDGILILLEKAFFYGIAIWTLRRAGASFAATVIVPTVVIGCAELAQIYLPGRTVETTDPILAILLGFAFETLEPQVPVRKAAPK